MKNINIDLVKVQKLIKKKKLKNQTKISKKNRIANILEICCNSFEVNEYLLHTITLKDIEKAMTELEKCINEEKSNLINNMQITQLCKENIKKISCKETEDTIDFF